MNRAASRSMICGPRRGFVRSSAQGMRAFVGVALLWAMAHALPCDGQITQIQNQTPSGPPVTRGDPLNAEQQLNMGSNDHVFEERQIRLQSIALHKSMVSDTDKLLKLVTELNGEINKDIPSELTPEQLRKVAEIEKLARNVREKMKSSVAGAALNMGAQPPRQSGRY